MSSLTGLFPIVVEITKRIDCWPVWKILFPQQKFNVDRLPWQKKILFFVAVTLLVYLTCFFYCPGGMIGFDWIHFWSKSLNPSHYPPWTAWFLPFANWNLFIGITVGGFSVLVFSRATSKKSAIISFFCLPFLWLVLLGQIDGIATSGLVALPLTIPIALIKPQITIFALLSKRSFLLLTIIFLLISFCVFGFWPSAMLSVTTIQSFNRAEQNIGLGGWWTILALIGLWFSRGDMDMMMLCGAVAVPYLIPYHLFPTVPAVSRLPPWAAMVAALTSWLPLSANWIGPKGWWLGWIYVAWVWCYLAIDRYRNTRVFQQVHQLFKQIKWTLKIR
ncbi:MAG TPA: hypothetical protein DEQ80_02985 [Anaerolinea thermolimosa]|uniref:DUF2029 domain-containing protein n=1 Tax=Anaerolinea thermolimosa TaxID=229919 RepID=A0A3D1JE54_9CHLR|nr:hypothetical protein [Anaerolinea thermolimosa]